MWKELLLIVLFLCLLRCRPLTSSHLLGVGIITPLSTVILFDLIQNVPDNKEEKQVQH